MKTSDLREALRSPQTVANNQFALLKAICELSNRQDEEEDAQEMVLRALEWREEFGECVEILDALARERRLFQYIEPDNLSLKDRIALEVHRPEALSSLGDNIVFHGPQAEVFWRLMEGQSVILSAPTSFGKSLIVDAVIASGKFRNILIVVPTIALIDETRRRITKRFRGNYKVLTHSSQETAERNVYIGTQERVLTEELPEGLDFFVIDEFYKLSPGRDDDGRCALLNQVFYRLAKTVPQFYLLGPNVMGISPACGKRLHFHAYHEPYKTVVSELHHVLGRGDPLERLVILCKELSEPTVIFCSSPSSTRKVLEALLEAGIGTSNSVCKQAASWIGKEYHSEWHFVKGLRAGIGIHHGRIPRALGQFVIKAFNEDELRFLICTSTLIEGVNTKAKNIVVFDNKINGTPIDLFTFNNIRGRAGRMRKHFVGHVYLFHDEPQQDLPIVDIPAYSQNDDAPESLLIQIDNDDLTEQSKNRLKKYLSEGFLDYGTLKANVGISPDKQIALAKDIANRASELQPYLAWNAFPAWDQLLKVCELIWIHFDGGSLGARSILSARQLAFKISALSKKPSFKALIASEVGPHRDADSAVQLVLDFTRLWAQFHFPRLLRAVGRIQEDVFDRRGMEAGNYDLYASKVENWSQKFWLSMSMEYPFLSLGGSVQSLNMRTDLMMC
jgi:hypothetical protein